MRALNDTQAVALTMVYLAKARQYSMGLVDGFTADCAQTALSHDPNNLNAMLLKAETMEEELLATIAGEDIQTHPQFAAYQQWLQHIYSLGYRELPQDMKEKLVKGWGKKSTGTDPVLNEEDDTRYASLSWGLFDEQVKNKQVEQYGRTLFNTATQTIAGFTTTHSAYNQYTYDPVIFAWEMDPLAHKMPGWSPYSVLGNSPITFVDPNGDIWRNGHVTQVKSAEQKYENAANSYNSLKVRLDNTSDPSEIHRLTQNLNRAEKTYNKALNNYLDALNSHNYVEDILNVIKSVNPDFYQKIHQRGNLDFTVVAVDNQPVVESSGSPTTERTSYTRNSVGTVATTELYMPQTFDEKSVAEQNKIIIHRAEDLLHGIGHPIMKILGKAATHKTQAGENNVNLFKSYIFNGADYKMIFDPKNYEEEER